MEPLTPKTEENVVQNIEPVVSAYEGFTPEKIEPVIVDTALDKKEEPPQVEEDSEMEFVPIKKK